MPRYLHPLGASRDGSKTPGHCLVAHKLPKCHQMRCCVPKIISFNYYQDFVNYHLLEVISLSKKGKSTNLVIDDHQLSQVLNMKCAAFMRGKQILAK